VPNARVLVAALLLTASASARAAETKLTAEALVAQHLQALGALPADAAASPRVLEGACRFEIVRGGAARLEGQTRFTSEARRLRVELKFDNSSYPGETWSADADSIDVGFYLPTRRSPLGNFLNAYDALLKEGLVGGTLSRAWPLLDLAGHKPKLKYEGVRKIDGQPVHQLRYQMARGQGEITIVMSFEADTFLHVNTTYVLRQRPGLGGEIQDSARQEDVIQRLEESFSEFVTVDGLKLPRRWRLKYETGGGAPNTFWTWDTTLVRAMP
jgi:hypothetical protein